MCVNDLVSRQATIEAVINLSDIFVNNLPPMKYATDVQEAINGVPPAQQWIPCSERLPDEDYCTGRGIQHSAEVLATVINHGADDETFVDMMVTVNGEWKIVHPIDGDNDIADWCEVVAWMPLPKPYKDGEQNVHSK